MNQSLHPPPGHEILTETIVKLNPKGLLAKAKQDSIWNPAKDYRLNFDEWDEWVFAHYDFSAPLGTSAAATTPVPEGRHECDTYVGTKVGEHFTNCPAHPRNRLVHVLPGELARLKEKPEGLLKATLGKQDWDTVECWPIIARTIGGVFDFAYCVPLHVREEIDRELAEQDRRCTCPAQPIPSIFGGRHMPECPLSTQTEKGGEPCASQPTLMTRSCSAAPAGVPSSQAAATDGNRPLPFDRDTLGAHVRNAWVRWAKSQPNPKPSWLLPYAELSEPDKEADRQIGEHIARLTLVGDAARTSFSATEPTAEEMLRWLKANAEIHFKNPHTGIGHGFYPFEGERALKSFRAAITAAMKGEK